MKFFNYFFIIAFVFLCAGTSFAFCVDYDGDGVCDATGSTGNVPMPTGIERVDTGTSSGSSSSYGGSISQSSAPTRTVYHSSGSSMESMVATTIAGSIIGGMFSNLFSLPPEPSGPTPEQIEAQRQFEEQKRKEFLRSNAELTVKLKGSGTTYVENKDVSTTGGLKLKSIYPVAPAASSSGDVHSGFFGQSGSAQPTVRLFREPMVGAGNGLLDPAEYKKAVSNLDMTQEERERLQLRMKVPLGELSDWMVDSRVLVQKERYTDPYLDVAMAAAKGGTTSVSVSLIEEGGKRFLKIIGAKNKGYDEVLSIGKAGVETPKNTAETVVMVGDYALTKAPLWTIAVDGAVNAVGAGTRQAIVRYWASKDSSKYYDPTPVKSAQEKWDSFCADQNQWTKAALNRVGAGEYK